MHGLVWHGQALAKGSKYKGLLVWLEQVRPGLVWSVLAWSSLVWSGLVWSGLVWSGLLWYNLVWSGQVQPGLAGPVLTWFRLQTGCNKVWEKMGQQQQQMSKQTNNILNLGQSQPGLAGFDWAGLASAELSNRLHRGHIGHICNSFATYQVALPSPIRPYQDLPCLM